jgi:glutathione synthase/RimK-type ligase-like ATP-grasp enzyme
MKPIGLLTSAELSDLIPDETHLVNAFIQENIPVRPVVWNSKQDWSEFSAVIIRSPWDYFEHQEEFFSTLKKIDEQTKLYNPYSLVKWNLDKNYLFDLKNKGGKLPPTMKVTSKKELDEAIASSQFNDMVIKPVISAGAYLTYRFNKNNIPAEVKNLPVDKYEFMIQPFLTDIQTEGEYSFIFLGGKFSHALVKRPKNGDFRVQSEYGGSVDAYSPTSEELKLTEFIHSILPEKPHYARIDLARYHGELVIMEVELLEPELFFRIRPDSAHQLVHSIKGSL